MNNNQISNPKKEVPKGITLNEKDYINSLLSCLKEMEKNYTIAMTEASNEYLYKEYHQIFNEIASLGRETYELMFRNGWYVIEQADITKINQKHQKLTQEITDLNS
ncbi:MAG: spore coat protein [Bacilli bacterium]|nr:spore coat protein [Bacilli bacterium]